MKFYLVYIMFFSLFATSNAFANEKVEGLFEATKTCPANKKLRSDNPGEIQLKIGELYEITAMNSDNPSHLLVIIPNAPVNENRWVGVECGEIALEDETLQADIEAKIAVYLIELKDNPPMNAPPMNTEKSVAKAQIPKQIAPVSDIENLLAASWLPTFCQTSAGSRAKECKSLNSDKIYAKQFSLHGLWPNDLDDTALYPCYCNQDKPLMCNQKQRAVSSLDLPSTLRNELKTKMPGSQSGFLDRHEWTKHGTCYEKYNKGSGQGSDPEEYFTDSINVLDQLNASYVGQLFAQNLGKVISDNMIYAAFDRSFGKGASDKVFIDCKRIGSNRVISELLVGMGGEIKPNSKLADLIAASPTRYEFTKQKSCRGGLVLKVR